MGAIIRLLIIVTISVMTVYSLVIRGVFGKGIISFAIALGYAMIAICVVISCMSQSSKDGVSGQMQESGGLGPNSFPSEPNGSVENDRIQ